jgi:hypothetical protein
MSELEAIEQHASERGGKCLSTEYWDDISNLTWMCDKGHVWELAWRFIKQGAWCPQCTKHRYSKEEKYEKLKAIAHEKGGECLSEAFVNSQTNLQFKCAKGHIWKTKAQIILKGSWCELCFKNQITERILEDLSRIVTEKGGVMISEYTLSREKIEFQCSKGHRWFQYQDAIINKGQWCPECGKEEWRKKHLEALIEAAKERGGECLSNEYISDSIKLKFKCDKGHEFLLNGTAMHRGQWCKQCSFKAIADKRKHSIDIYRAIAQARGGKLLSEEYINKETKLLWECKEGHRWEATPGLVKNAGTWCGICGKKESAAKLRDNIETYRKIAMERGGKLLSEVYINSQTPLLWECKEGHQWKAHPDSVKNLKTWCPVCCYKDLAEKFKDNIEVYHKIAIERGGKLLSEEYINSKTHMLWECKDGHQWKATGEHIKTRKSWCPVCSYKERGSANKDDIETYRKIAIEMGGKLLSEEYINSKTPLLWECKEGHQWKATPSHIKNRNQWCPACAYKTRGVKRSG